MLRRYRWFGPGLLLALGALIYLPGKAAIQCENGQAVSADLGEGVIMHTCMWEQQPDVVIRTGPMELVKNGILILKTQTNLKGQLHGRFSNWSDEGVLMEDGFFDQGLRQGTWMFTDVNGVSRRINYLDGVPTGL